MENKPTCPLCQGELVHDDDIPCKEIGYGFAEDDNAMLHTYTCEECGSLVEVWEKPEEEKQNYGYWNQ